MNLFFLGGGLKKLLIKLILILLVAFYIIYISMNTKKMLMRFMED